MRFEAKSFLDKNGNPFILRNAELNDASDLIRYLKVVAEETPWLIREPEEVSLTEEQEREFLQSKIDAERELMLVAMVDGKHAGNCSLMRVGELSRYRHRCDVGIALYQEYCGRGYLHNAAYAEYGHGGYNLCEPEYWCRKRKKS